MSGGAGVRLKRAGARLTGITYNTALLHDLYSDVDKWGGMKDDKILLIHVSRFRNNIFMNISSI